VATASVAYLLLLLIAAAFAGRKRGRTPSLVLPVRVAVIIPAHNEEPVLGATLASLRQQCYAAELLEVVVVADNCTDGTARIAREAGVTVLERVDPVRRGKGYALNWAVVNLLGRPDPPDAFLIVDADTWVAPDFVSIMAAELAARKDHSGCCALQGRYGVLNTGDSWRATLMTAAFELVNHIRPLGVERLGLSVGLKGNGMGFTRAVLERAPWEGRSITEDIDYGLDLLRHHNLRVGYVPEACVRAQMPVTSTQATSQRERWEVGRYALLRQRALPLLGQGLCRGSLRQMDAAIQLLVPPLAELCGMLLLWGAVIAAGASFGLLPAWSLWIGAWLCAAVGLVAYVLGGLAVAGAPGEVYLALLRAPGYALWKAALYASRLFRKQARGESEWVRTERHPITGANAEALTGRPAVGTTDP
jgi:glycosyltransferase involved in cell wall biosynthesis